MSYNVEATIYFTRQLKRLIKKYPSLKSEMSDLIESLEANSKQGIPIGKECYKIRLVIGSKGNGKSGDKGNYTCLYSSENRLPAFYV